MPQQLDSKIARLEAELYRAPGDLKAREETIAGLDKALEEAKDSSSEARKRLAVRRTIRDAEELIEANKDKPERYLAHAFLFRAQQGVAISFLEDVWTRNLLNVFVAPIRNSEYLAAMFLLGLIRILVTVVILTLIAYFAYEFNVFDMKIGLIPFFANQRIYLPACAQAQRCPGLCG